MKRRLLLTLIVLFTLSISAHAQKRRAPSRASQARTYCQGDRLPAGFVVVSMKESQKCEGKPALEIKRPEDTEAVCDGFPHPRRLLPR
jgi:hypothetical protein